MQTVLFWMQKYIGILDLIIILLFILGMIIGCMYGFFRGALKIGNIVSGFLFSVVFAKPISKFLGLFLYDPLYNHYANKISGSSALDSLTGSENMIDVMESAGIPRFIAKLIAGSINPETVENLKETIVYKASNTITNAILIVISFFILLIGTSIFLFIIRKFIEALRESKGFRIFDGILGFISSVVIVFCIVTIIFFVLTFFKSGSVYSFLNTDLRLESQKGFGLGRWFYSHNILRTIFDIIF
ncbi:MAG: CvpA family protein [Anaeroplasmataceae bacterium]